MIQGNHGQIQSSHFTRLGFSNKFMIKVIESHYRHTLQYGPLVCQIFLVPKNENKKAKSSYNTLVKAKHELNAV